MTDRSVRERLRRWRDSGLVEDEARYLLALVRVAAFDPAKLGVAAVLGHQAAAHALELAGDPAQYVPRARVSPRADGSARDGQRWRVTWTNDYTRTLRLVQSASAVDPRAGVVARCGVAAACLGVLTAARPGQRRPAQFLEATRRWLSCPSPARLRRARAVYAKLRKGLGRPRRGFQHEFVADAAAAIWSPAAAPEVLPFARLATAFDACEASWEEACQHAQSWLYDWSRPPT